MTRTEYERIRTRIDARYYGDIAALERIWKEFNGDEALPVAEEPGRRGQKLSRQKSSRQKLSIEEKRERQRAYQKAWRANKKAGTVGAGRRQGRNSDERGVKDFHKFLVPGPVRAGGNGQ